MSGARCPNCNAEVTGRYCSQCGQRQGDIPNLREWLSELLDEVLGLESRLPRTLATLVWPPGRLTREWWSGRRASQVSPLRLYLVAAVPFFFFLAQRTVGHDSTSLLADMVTIGYLTANPMPAGEPAMAPLPPELRNDSAARAKWQREYQRRRAENKAVHEASNREIRGGVRNVFGVLPIVVGLVMVPLLAVISGGGHRKFVAKLVFSLHLHTVGYTALMLSWLVGGGTLGGLGAAALYLGVARRNAFGDSRLAATLNGIAIPAVYLAMFMVLYVGFVGGMSELAPSWIFTKA